MAKGSSIIKGIEIGRTCWSGRNFWGEEEDKVKWLGGG